MKTLSRRGMLGMAGTGLLGAALLAGCTTTTVGSTTTVTLSVAKIQAYVKAGINAGNTISTVISAIPTVSQYEPKIEQALDLLKSTSAAFEANLGDKLTIVYDDASVKTLVDSILVALQLVVDQIGAVVLSMMANTDSIPDSKILKAKLTRDSLATIISIFSAILTQTMASSSHLSSGSVQTRYAANEFHALKTLGV